MENLTERYTADIEKTLDFVDTHIDNDVTSLILNRSKWPEIDMELAVNCIESRRKLRNKVPEWYENKNLVFPLKLSAEQCSSTMTGRYKAELAVRIVQISTSSADGKPARWKLADLTGGMGIDSWFFSGKASEVLYCEMKESLCLAACHNFKVLEKSGHGGGNIIVRNCCIESENVAVQDRAANSVSPENLLKDFGPDIVYADPARRSETGRKVFLIEECTPDILTLKDEIFSYARHLLLKLSPMADITMACSRLGNQCREVHIVSANDECKELLIWMDREWNGGYTITATDSKSGNCLTFSPEEEKEATADIASDEQIAEFMSNQNEDRFLFEPGKALMKAGAFNIVGKKSGLLKLGASTHYYIGYGHISKDLQNLGKLFRIIRLEYLDKKTLKQAGTDFPGADITARNLPADTDTYRRKMKISPKGDSGLNKHIFLLKSDGAGALLIAGEKVIG